MKHSRRSNTDAPRASFPVQNDEQPALPEKLDRIRQRLDDGYYLSETIAKATAQIMLMHRRRP